MTPTTNDPLIGKILAERYRITELVGSGRFSIVYKGQHLFMDRAVAMKTLQANLAEDQTVIKRFEKEAVALSKLRHPNIVSVYDCFVHTNGQPFLVMDFLDGHTLEELLTDRGAIPPKLMRAIVFQASAGLAHAHNSGVLHRDIKPDNIILLPREKTDERVRLLDFGFALLQGDMERLTLSGTLCGSPAYISPERWKGKELDARSDIYSLAVVMYQGLTGQLPFKAGSLEELRNMHVEQEPPPIGDILPALKEDTVAQSILHKAMAKNPEERYQTMKEFHNAVKLWSPNSDDAEIAQWAKNVMPKPAPQAVPNAVQAQPLSLQPPPGFAAPGTVAGTGAGAAPTQPGQLPLSAQVTPGQSAPGQPAAGQSMPAAGQPGSAQPMPGQPMPGHAAAPPMQTAPGAPSAMQNVQAFDDVTTLPTNQATPKFNDVATLQDKAVGPTFDEIETLQSTKAGQDNGEQSFVEMPDAPGAAPGQPAGAGQTAAPGQPGSPAHPNSAQRTVEVSLEQGSPLSPEAMARIQIPNPRASLTKQDVAYIKAIAQTLGDSLGEQAKSIEITPSLEGQLPMRDETTKLSFNSMPPPAPASTAPEAAPKIVPVVDRRQKRTGEDGVGDDAAASSSAPATAGSAQQNVASEWSAKQEVAPWVQNPDDFKPRPGFAEGAPTFGTGPTGPSPFGAPASGPPVPPGFAPGPLAPPAVGAPNASPNPFMANAAPQNAFGTPPGVPPGSPSKDPSTISSSRISPMMPGSSGAHEAPSAVPWTNATSSSPVDFGKIFDDKSPPEPSVPIPPSPITNSLGTEIASPTASMANLSIVGGNERSAPPKGDKKRNRLPTFVDRDAPLDEPQEAAPKKSMSGLLIGGAVAVFIFAGIGIATWLMTNVNPSGNNASPNTAVVAPVKGSSSQDNQPAASKQPAPTTATEKPEPTDTASSDDSSRDTAKTPEEPVKTSTAPPVKPAVKPAKTEPPKAAAKPAPPAAESKEPPTARGWFGMPTFNQQKDEEKAATKPAVTADASHEPPAKPKKKKPKKKKPAVAQRSSGGGGSSGGLSGGYVEVEVTPGRRAYRSY